MADPTPQRNLDTTLLLLQDAMPNGGFDLIRSLVTSDAPIRRAGFADLSALTGDAIPQSGNFVEWLEAGWKALSGVLTAQDIVASGDTVMLKYALPPCTPARSQAPRPPASVWSGTRSACCTSTTPARSPTCGSCARS
jgi:hypothetical protein